MISNGDGWHYLAVKKYQQSKSESQKKVCENKYFCMVAMTSEDIKILEFDQYQNSDIGSFFYADQKCLIEKIDGCKKNRENSSTTTVGEHTRSGFSMFTISSFKNIQNKYDV